MATPGQDFSYLGTTVKYPITVKSGSIELVTGKETVESSLIMILTTPYGSRFFRPDYGCRIQELLYEPNDEVLKRLLTVYIAEAIGRWETRIKLVSIDPVMGVDSALILITYRILASGEIDSFVFPFIKRPLDF